MSIEVMKQALEALEKSVDNFMANTQHQQAITTLRQAIAEAEGISLMPIKHPVGPKWDGDINPDSLEEIEIDLPKREWVGLTDEEINSVRYKRDWTAPWTDKTFARAIEAKLKEKNHG